MQFIDKWTREFKIPIPQKIIVAHVSKEGTADITAKMAVRTLVTKGYLRKAASGRASYVQCRSVMY